MLRQNKTNKAVRYILDNLRFEDKQELIAKYGKKSDFILSVQPGLSGMWQISGRSDTGYEERVTLDSYYIQNWSVWLDIWIIIKTVYVVLRGKGAY